MASCIAPVSISGGSHLQASEICFAKPAHTFGKTPSLAVQRKPMASNHRFSVCAEYRDGTKGGGNDFAAGFLLGGALFWNSGIYFCTAALESYASNNAKTMYPVTPVTLGWFMLSFSCLVIVNVIPQHISGNDEMLIAVVSCNEWPFCYTFDVLDIQMNMDSGRQSDQFTNGGLGKRGRPECKIRQLNSAIDNVSSRLRGGNNSPSVPVETDPEVEATSKTYSM
ncbi:hypothetical protein CXB51_034471 [Gossypium anomalum]|uniref:Uncharacterized protein n=1 Tax=Gossypium anomalum TaxID=47600 RepID=A0A8J5XMG2_9ROSI|nr:hypothetical protein CXB51_034471 [Gossypium anomalum]